MRVLQVSCNDLSNGGVQNVFMGIINNIKDIQFDLVVFGSGDGYYKSQFQDKGHNLFKFNIYNGNSFLFRCIDRIFWSIRLPIFIIRLNNKYGPYDAIHCHNYFEAFLCNFGAYLAGIKIRIAHSHNSADPLETKKYKLYCKLLRNVFKRFTNYRIGCSKKANEYLYGNDNNTIVINNYVDTDYFSNSYNNMVKNDYEFVHIGRFCYQKNQRFLLDIFKNIYEYNNDAHLNMIGYGPDEERIKKYIEENNLQDSVTMYHSNFDKRKILGKSKFMIFPSRYEGFGIVMLEAQFMNVYCFASTKVPNNTNIGLAEYLSLKKNAKEWSSHIIKVIKKIEVNGLPSLMNTDKVSKDVIMEKYNDLYKGRCK